MRSDFLANKDLLFDMEIDNVNQFSDSAKYTNDLRYLDKIIADLEKQKDIVIKERLTHIVYRIELIPDENIKAKVKSLIAENTLFSFAEAKAIVSSF